MRGGRASSDANPWDLWNLLRTLIRVWQRSRGIFITVLAIIMELFLEKNYTVELFDISKFSGNLSFREVVLKITFVCMKILIPWIFMKSELHSQSFVAFTNIFPAGSCSICANNTFLSSIFINQKICSISDFFTTAFTVMCDTLHG